jgi:hypothetical protein
MKLILEEVDENETYIKDFVKNRLNLSENVDITNSESGIQATVEITDSDKLGVVMSKLDKNNDFDSNDDATTVNDSGWVRIYNMKNSPFMSVTIIGDYESDYNKIVLFINKSEGD